MHSPPTSLADMAARIISSILSGGTHRESSDQKLLNSSPPFRSSSDLCVVWNQPMQQLLSQPMTRFDNRRNAAKPNAVIIGPQSVTLHAAALLPLLLHAEVDDLFHMT
jgi:hypothetical protein